MQFSLVSLATLSMAALSAAQTVTTAWVALYDLPTGQGRKENLTLPIRTTINFGTNINNWADSVLPQNGFCADIYETFNNGACQTLQDTICEGILTNLKSPNTASCLILRPEIEIS